MDQVLKTRSLTAIVFAAIVTGLIFYGRSGALFLLCIIAAGSSFEFSKIVSGSRRKATMAAGISLLAAIAIYTLPVSVSLMGNIAAVVVISQLYLLSTMYTGSNGGYESTMPFYTLLYPTLPIMLLFHMVIQMETYDALLFFSIICLIWVSDSGAYLVGRKLGKRKLFERISPKKTWEGSLGAGLFTLLFGIIYYFLIPQLGLSFWVISSITIWIAGTYGDLVESSVKRRYNVKDSGNFMPGHGGFFDRFDSFIFVSPFIYIIYIIFKIII